jgi:hypothetical protein
MVDVVVICEELEAIIERHMMDVSHVEPFKDEPTMIVHLLDGSQVLIEVSDAS